MSERRAIRSFYRIATAYPPPDDDYLTAHERGRRPRPDATEEERRSFNGLSAFDALEAARRQGRRFRRLGTLIVRYDIPIGSGIVWEQSGSDPHHFDLFGDREQLKQFIAADVLDVCGGVGG